MSKHADQRLSAPRYWLTWLGVGLFWLIGQLPWNMLLAFGRLFGRLAWRLLKRRRHIAETNIRLCFPELDAAQQKALAYANLVSTGEGIMELAGTYFNKRVDLSKRLTIKGMENLKALQAQGQGIILLGMHLNSIDVGSRLLGEVLDFNAVYRPNDNPVIDWMMDQGRSQNVNTISKYDMKQMVRCLRKGEVVWYAPDQDYGTKHAVFVPFFGQTAATLTATSRLARMGRAKVIPCAHYRHPGGRYTIVFGEPLDSIPSGDETADTQLVNATIEQFVRQHPEQYLWVHRRFKHQPEGSKSIY